MDRIIRGPKSTIGSCNECIHILGQFCEAGTCKAFPNGIPDEIFRNSHSHTKVLPEQEGDYVFEMKERYKKVYKKIEASKKKNNDDKT